MNKKYIDHIQSMYEEEELQYEDKLQKRTFVKWKLLLNYMNGLLILFLSMQKKICTTKNIVNYSFFFDGADTHLWKIQVWFSICMWMHAIRINKSIHGEINATFGKPKGVYLSSKKNKEEVLLYQLGYG